MLHFYKYVLVFLLIILLAHKYYSKTGCVHGVIFTTQYNFSTPPTHFLESRKPLDDANVHSIFVTSPESFVNHRLGRVYSNNNYIIIFIMITRNNNTIIIELPCSLRGNGIKSQICCLYVRCSGFFVYGISSRNETRTFTSVNNNRKKYYYTFFQRLSCFVFKFKKSASIRSIVLRVNSIFSTTDVLLEESHTTVIM